MCSRLISSIIDLTEKNRIFALKNFKPFIDVINNSGHSYVTCGQEACMKPIRNSPWNVIFWHVRALSCLLKQQNRVEWNIVWCNAILYKKKFLFLFLCFWVSVCARSSNKMYSKTFYRPFPIQIVLLSPMTEITWVTDAATIFCITKLLCAPKRK